MFSHQDSFTLLSMYVSLSAIDDVISVLAGIFIRVTIDVGMINGWMVTINSVTKAMKTQKSLSPLRLLDIWTIRPDNIAIPGQIILEAD